MESTQIRKKRSCKGYTLVELMAVIAIMAALAGGAYASWDELAKVVTADRVIRPDMAAHAVYEKQRVVFNELYTRNKDLMKSL